MEVSAHALRYFVALAEEGHMGRAAVRLHLTPPSLSQQVARLERQLGAALFVRTRRGVELTDAGAELLPLARGAVEAHEAVTFWAAGRASSRPGVVRIGVFAAAAASLRPAALTTMQEDHPDVELRTRRIGADEAFGALREQRIDVAYLPGPLQRDVAGLRCVTVTRQQRMVVVPTDHPLAERDQVDVEETNDEVFLRLAGVPEASVAWWLVDPRADGSHPARGPEASDFEELLDSCAAGAGLAMASSFAAHDYRRPGLSFVPLVGVEDATTMLCWRADERDPAVRAFVSIVRRVSREQDPS